MGWCALVHLIKGAAGKADRGKADGRPVALSECPMPLCSIRSRTSFARCSTPDENFASPSSALRSTYSDVPSLPPTTPAQLLVSRMSGSITTAIIRRTPLRSSA
eukprot:5037278-Prymnesium_polylepis.1